MARNIKIISGSFKGTNKSRNEDDILILDLTDHLLLCVFDGVGSANGSLQVVKFAKNFIEKDSHLYFKNSTYYLDELLCKLNKMVIGSGIHQPFTTCAIVLISKLESNHTKFISLGDTRIYAVGKQYISQLSTDHVQPQNTNILTKYLGNKDLKQSDFSEIVFRGDESRILICTDGFYKSINDLGEFHRILNLKYIKRVETGIQRLLDKTNTDDATYIYATW